MENTYYKVVGITIDALSVDIIADGNVKEIVDGQQRTYLFFIKGDKDG